MQKLEFAKTRFGEQEIDEIFWFLNRTSELKKEWILFLLCKRMSEEFDLILQVCHPIFQ